MRILLPLMVLATGPSRTALRCPASCQVLVVCLFDLTPAIPCVPGRLQPCGQPLVDALRQLLDLSLRWEQVRGIAATGHRPQETPPLAQRVLQQHRVAGEQLLLNGGERERPRLRQGRVARAPAADFRLDLLVAIFEIAVRGGIGFVIERRRCAVAPRPTRRRPC